MSAPKLPVLGSFGKPPRSPEHAKTVTDAVSDMVEALNALPEEARMPVLCSVVITVCCNQIDPEELFAIIGLNVGSAIAQFLQQPAGHG